MYDDASIARYITETFKDAQADDAYGYTQFFYGADRKMPFATIAHHGNQYEAISALDRPGVFRLNIGISKQTFRSLIGPTPAPPGPSGVLETGDDFTTLDRLMPHPHYGHMRWVCVLNPSEATFAKVRELLAEAYEIAERRDAKRASSARSA